MDIVVEVLRIIGIGLLGLFSLFAVLGLIVNAVQGGAKAVKAIRRWRGRRARGRRRRNATHEDLTPRREPASEPPTSEPPEASFAHVLLVEVDDAAGVLAPMVELTTNVPLLRGRLRLEVVDDDGEVRAHGEQALARRGALTRACFESFELPAGASVVEALEWRWDVVVVDATGERAHWQERLNPVGRIDAEAELMVTEADPPPEPEDSRTGRLGYTTEDLIRILREAGLDNRSRPRSPTAHSE